MAFFDIEPSSLKIADAPAYRAEWSGVLGADDDEAEYSFTLVITLEGTRPVFSVRINNADGFPYSLEEAERAAAKWIEDSEEISGYRLCDKSGLIATAEGKAYRVIKPIAIDFPGAESAVLLPDGMALVINRAALKDNSGFSILQKQSGIFAAIGGLNDWPENFTAAPFRNQDLMKAKARGLSLLEYAAAEFFGYGDQLEAIKAALSAAK